MANIRGKNKTIISKDNEMKDSDKKKCRNKLFGINQVNRENQAHHQQIKSKYRINSKNPTVFHVMVSPVSLAERRHSKRTTPEPTVSIPNHWPFTPEPNL